MKCPHCDDERISRIQHMECDACGHWWCDGDIEQALAASRRALTMAEGCLGCIKHCPAQAVHGNKSRPLASAIKGARTMMNRVDGKKEVADG